MALQPDAVAGTVLKEFFKPGIADLIERFLVDFFGNGTFFQFSAPASWAASMASKSFLARSLGLPMEKERSHSTLYPPICAPKLKQIASPDFEPILAGNGVRKCRALAERNQAAERSIHSDPDHVAQFGGKLVGDSVRRCFQDLILSDRAIALHEFPSRLDRKISEIHGAAHEP